MPFSTGPFLLLLKQFSLDGSRAIHCSLFYDCFLENNLSLSVSVYNICYRESTVDDCIEGQGWLGKWENQVPQAGLKEWKGKGSHAEKRKDENVGEYKIEEQKKPVYLCLIFCHLYANFPQDLYICWDRWKLFDAELLIKKKKRKIIKKKF